MRGSDEIQSILQRAIRNSSADCLEAVYAGHETHLTRFANNHVHQNVSERNSTVTVRALVQGKVGSGTTNDLSVESVKRTVQTATNAALAQSGSGQPAQLAQPAQARTVDSFDPDVEALTPADRASAAGHFCATASEARMVAAGFYSSSLRELGIANTNGVSHYHTRTEIEASAVMQGESGTGYADRLGTRLREVDTRAVAAEALQKAQLAQRPQDLAPGVYEVLLETYAVQDLASFLSYLSFGARAVQEGRSFMAGKLGQQVMSPLISFWDDGADPSGLSQPFDYEGTPKERVELVRDGVAKGVVYDLVTAASGGVRSTGHALPPGSGAGPMPTNLFLQAGDKTREELLAGVERGILVTRFWYTRVVHPLPVIITGMTRDGTFLVEDGRIRQPVRNLRFTTSYLEALNDVRGVGRETALAGGWMGSCRVPALHLGAFTFTGATEF
ncbi:MAG: TldD/PmbA family protein [Chloroflexota bacterium]|nr:TldD/PmbA family protein [Chloroflexota bacterium]